MAYIYVYGTRAFLTSTKIIYKWNSNWLPPEDYSLEWRKEFLRKKEIRKKRFRYSIVDRNLLLSYMNMIMC